MQVAPNLFKAKLALGRPLLGCWLMSASATCAEAVGWCGLDFTVVDMEHVPLDVPDVIDILRALAPSPTGTVTRVPWNDAVMVKRVLDAGAQTLMFPMVQSVDEAVLAVRATRYPPNGIRGVAGVHRASRYGAVAEYLHSCQQELQVIVQVETPAAYVQISEIAAVDGVDCVFIGPADLAANSGHLGNMQHPDILARLAEAPGLIRARGKKAGILVPTMEMGRRMVSDGYDFVAVASDIAAITGTLRRYVADWAQAPVAASSGY